MKRPEPLKESRALRCPSFRPILAKCSAGAVSFVLFGVSTALAQPVPADEPIEDRAPEAPEADAPAPADDPKPPTGVEQNPTAPGVPAEASTSEAPTAPAQPESAAGKPPPVQPALGTSSADAEPSDPPGEPLPVWAPPAAEPSAPSSGGEEQEPTEAGDEILYSGYLPGYRPHQSLGRSPYVPRVGSLPGGMTAGYGAPMPPTEWTFSYSGFMSASFQVSADRRPRPSEGQTGTVFHVPPQTIDNFASFVSTNSIPGNWVNMRFRYGNSRVSANVSIDTWNPTRPTTYYQLGSQFFMNNIYLSYTPENVGGVNLQIDAGRFNMAHGGLGRWGGGMYVNPLIATTQGVGVRTLADYDLFDSFKLRFEHNLMTRRDGKVPNDVVPDAQNGYRRPLWPAAWIHGLHAGFDLTGEPRVEVRLHHMVNWAQDDRIERERDDATTRQVDETDLEDGAIHVFGGDVKIISDPYGSLGFGVSYLTAHDAYPLQGFITYGGTGEQLTDLWFGQDSAGTGRLMIGAINYEVSLGQVVSHPQTFNGNGPDIVLRGALHATRTETVFEPWDGRYRYKYAGDVLYTFLRNLGAGVRVDRVIPNSKDPEETFLVVAPRLQIKTDWTSRETFQIMYAKWFYGSRTRNEGTGERTPERLDDELFALNMSMWW